MEILNRALRVAPQQPALFISIAKAVVVALLFTGAAWLIAKYAFDVALPLR